MRTTQVVLFASSDAIVTVDPSSLSPPAQVPVDPTVVHGHHGAVAKVDGRLRIQMLEGEQVVLTKKVLDRSHGNKDATHPQTTPL